MRLEVGGQEYEGFATAQMTMRLDQLCNEFSFTATSGGPEDEGGLPFVQGQSVRILVDGEQMFSGFIEEVKVSGSAKQHTIVLSGRDRACDLVDGMIGSLGDFSAPSHLKDIIEVVIAHLEIPELAVVDLVEPEPFNAAEDLAAPDIGDNAFLFIEALVRKRQVMLSSDGYGSIAIISGKGQATDDRILHLRDDLSNNVLNYSMGYNGAARFFQYLAITQGAPATGGIFGGQTDEALASAIGIALDEGARPGRQFVIGGESSMSPEQAQRRAAWQAKINRVRSHTYSTVMSGFRAPSGDLWRLNTVPNVVDEFVGIDGAMLINSVTFSQTAKGQGKSTLLGLVEEDAYTTSLAEPKATTTGKGPVAWEGLQPVEQDEAAAGESAALKGTSGPKES